MLESADPSVEATVLEVPEGTDVSFFFQEINGDYTSTPPNAIPVPATELETDNHVAVRRLTKGEAKAMAREIEEEE